MSERLGEVVEEAGSAGTGVDEVALERARLRGGLRRGDEPPRACTHVPRHRSATSPWSMPVRQMASSSGLAKALNATRSTPAASRPWPRPAPRR